MADAGDIVEPGVVPDSNAAPPVPEVVPEIDQGAEASKAREAVTRPRKAAPIEAAPKPDIFKVDKSLPPESPIGESPFEGRSEPQDNGPENIERFRLNAVNSYYKGTVMGSLALKTMADIYETPDSPDMSPEIKQARNAQRDQYEQIVADLMAYEVMPTWSGLPQFAMAVGGTVAGSLPSPESFAGWAANGGTWTVRTMKAAFQQGLITGATDPAIQMLNKSAGVHGDYEFTETLEAVAFGAALGGGMHGLGEAAGPAFRGSQTAYYEITGQRHLRRDLFDYGRIDRNMSSADAALWGMDPRNGIQMTPDASAPTLKDPLGRPVEPPKIQPKAEEFPSGPDHGFQEAIDKLLPELKTEARYGAFRSEVGPEVDALLLDHGFEFGEATNIMEHYRRAPGEHPKAALARAVDDWYSGIESEAIRLSDLDTPDSALRADWLLAERIQAAYDRWAMTQSFSYQSGKLGALGQGTERTLQGASSELLGYGGRPTHDVPFEPGSPTPEGVGVREGGGAKAGEGEGAAGGGQGSDNGGGRGGERPVAQGAAIGTERLGGPQEALGTAAKAEGTDGPVPGWLKSANEDAVATAARLGLTDDVARLAQEGFTANQISERLNGRLSSAEVRAVREAAGIAPTGPTIMPGGATLDVQPLIANRAGSPMPFEERRDPNAGVPSSPDPLSLEQRTALRSLHQVTLGLAEKLDVPIRQGHVTGGKETLGIYKTKAGVVRVRELGDFEVVKHEVGHAIEAKVGPELTALTQQHLFELGPLDYDQGATGMRANEGFAEWMRVRMTNPRRAKNLAPDFYDAFNSLMMEKRPDILNLISETAIAHRAWLGATSLDVASAIVRNTIPDPLGTRAMKEQLEREGITPTVSTMMQKFYERIQDQYTHYVDKFADIERAVHEMAMQMSENQGGAIVDVKAAYDPSVLIRSAHAVSQTALVESLRGMVPHRGTTSVGPGMSAVMQKALGKPSVLGKWDEAGIVRFDAYLNSRMVEYLWRRWDDGLMTNEPSSMKPGDARQAVMEFEAANPTFREAGDLLQVFIDNMRQKAFDAGLWDMKMLEALRQYEFYVPMKRVKEGGAGGRGPADGATLKSDPQRRRGSELDVDSPLRNVMRSVFMLENDIRQNEIRMGLLRMAEQIPGEGGTFAERLVGHEAKEVVAPLQEMLEARAREVGVDPGELRSFVDRLLDGEEGPLMGSFWRYEQLAAKGQPIVFGWENGQPVPMRLMSKQAGERFGLYEVMTATPSQVLDTWMNIIQFGSSTLRAGIVNSPVFILTNYIKDQLQMALSQPGYIPFFGGLKGIAQEVRGDPIAVMRAYTGGVMGGQLTNELKAKFTDDVRDLTDRGYLVKTFTTWHGLLEAMQITEAGTRNSIFERTYKQKLKQGLSAYEAMWEAARESNDIMDFSRHGDRMEVLRKIVPFLNANIQGQDRYTFRTLIEPGFKALMGENVTVRDQEMAQKSIYSWMLAGGGGIAFGAAFAAINWDRPEYRDATPEMKGTHIVIPMADGKIFTFPKPFELGVGFTAGEYAYAAMVQKDPRAAEQFREAMFEAFMPPNPLTSIPFMTLPAELGSGMANVGGWKYRPIVPDTIRNKAHPELEYNDRTSPLAKQIGAMLGVSPMKVDFAIGSQFGTNGRDLMAVSGMVDKDTPTAALDDMLFVRRFMKDAQRTSATTQVFWELMGSKTGKYSDHAEAYRKLVTEVVKRGQDPAKADALMQGLTDSERAYVVLKEGAGRTGQPAFTADDRRLHPLVRAHDAVKVLNDVATELQSNTLIPYRAKEALQLSPDQRRNLIDNIRIMAGEEMRNGMAVVKEKGYADRPIYDINDTMAKIRHVSPNVADEIANRYATAKVYSFNTIRAVWPQMEQELVRYGTSANIRPEAARARGAGFEFRGLRAPKPGVVRAPIAGTAASPTP